MIILFLTSSFLGLMVAIGAMSFLHLPIVPAFALYLGLGIALPLWAIVNQMKPTRAKTIAEQAPF
ncbi:hypothetical protein BVC71_01550 [Marivivens niveibacter]|uniref:Uncharacterized protein n=1 Tax=Marivivens niveibacter TaxID=1930667 RepID=A0A251X1E9_9RHOB|nr:hypothetical protein [Marivivens niveibacter]OUD10225.1 hypothetical protein BVC71_01550 [Marivivens niveibacter]